MHEVIKVKSSIKMLLYVVRTYDWLLDLYVVDFFVDNHWDKLPLSWRESFGEMDAQTLGNIILGKPVHTVVPLSFLALLKTIDYLTISRQQQRKECFLEGNFMYGKHDKFNNLFLKHVKLKKRHEISLMAEVVKDVANQTSCGAVLDFGSGLGHLVRVLAYKYNLYAAGLECQSQLTEEARKLDCELEYNARKHLTKDQIEKQHRPAHLNVTLTSHQQLTQLELPEGLQTYGLVGLHPCGDLGPLLLKHFVKCNKVKFICLVGCCFMKLTTDGYPLSEYTKSLNSKLSYTSREIACHAIEVYCERLQQGNYNDLKIHAYRAALEKILVDIDPKLKHSQIRSIKHSDSMTFQKYCSLALERVKIPSALREDAWRLGCENVAQWRRVVTVYTLRLAIAPLVESLILLDRLLYILEQGMSCEIRPVFDPKISPRNHIMIARRN